MELNGGVGGSFEFHKQFDIIPLLIVATKYDCGMLKEVYEEVVP